MLLFDIQAQDGFGDFGIHILDGIQYALAEVAGFVAITQLDGLAAAGGGARGHSGAAKHAGFQENIGFYGRVAARIQNFTGDHINDCAQFISSFSQLGSGWLPITRGLR